MYELYFRWDQQTQQQSNQTWGAQNGSANNGGYNNGGAAAPQQNWSNDSFGCNYQQGYTAGPTRNVSTYNTNNRAIPYAGNNHAGNGGGSYGQ